MTTHDHHSGLGDVEAVNGRDEVSHIASVYKESP